MKKILTVLFILTFYFIFAPFAQGAVLYLEPAERELRLGETFIEEIKIDTEGECVNVVGADLSFSQDTLEAIDFSSGNSILTLWVKTPSIDREAGLISFAGGVPGGYCGEIFGAPAESNLIGRAIFKVKEMPDFTLEEGRFGEEQPWARIKFLESSIVLLHDGRGTPDRLTKKGAVFPIVFREIKKEVLANIWQEELEKDNNPPEEFSPEINQDLTIYEGKYFLTFSTTDKQTGVDHFEIFAQKRILLGLWGKEKREIAESPYLLKDQELRSKILIKAVDKAGNERIATITPKIHWKDVLPWVIIISLIIAAIWWFIRKLKIKSGK